MRASLLYACSDFEDITFTLHEVEVIVVYYGNDFGIFRRILRHMKEKRYTALTCFWHRRASTDQEALTFGLQHAHGDMVMRWDKNLEYFPNFVDRLYHPLYDFTYSAWMEDGDMVSPSVHCLYKSLRCYMWNTKFLQWMGGWTDHYPDHQDIPLLYRTLLLSNHTLFIDESLAVCHTKKNRLLEYYMQLRMDRVLNPVNPRAFTLYHVNNLENNVQQLVNLESFLFHHPSSYVLIDRCLNHYYFMENYPNAIFGKYGIKQADDVDLQYFYTSHCRHPDSKMILDYGNIQEAVCMPDILYLFRCKRERTGSLLIGIHYSASTITLAKAIQKQLKKHLVVKSDKHLDRLVDVIIWLDDYDKETITQPLDKTIHEFWTSLFNRCHVTDLRIAFPFLHNLDIFSFSTSVVNHIDDNSH